LTIAKESFWFVITLIIATIVTYALLPALTVIPGVLLFFVIFFFRNPSRQVTEEQTHILSPADGTIQSVEEIKESTYIKDKAIKISIFLSIFDVHFNRSPISGNIDFIEYRSGKHLSALNSHASAQNERNTIGIHNHQLKILVHQIAGLLARRIVCYNSRGDHLKQGQIFGLIKFGSCTELLVPAKVKVQVQKGQKVKAGITVLGVLEND